MPRKGFRSSRRKKPKGPIGKVGRSQAISLYGPGSLYELRNFRDGVRVNSVIIAGLDHWPLESIEENIVPEPTLAASLGVDRFLAPPSLESDEEAPAIPAFRFPEWLECSHCQRIGRIHIHFDEEIDKAPRCKANDCDGYGVPTRLILACYADDESQKKNFPGHIDNFPWEWWAHSNSEAGICSNPEVYLKNDEGKKAGISGLVLRCAGCPASRTLGDVFKTEALKPIGCGGYRPWLGARKDKNCTEDCDRPVRALLRGASNIYFPVTASAISIPPLSNKVVIEMQKRGNQFISAMQGIKKEQGEIDVDTFVDMFRNGGFRHYSPDEIRDGISIILEEAESGAQKLNEQQQKKRERSALVIQCSEDDDENEFQNYVVPDVELSGFLNSYLEKLVMVERLREVRAIRGFQRVESSPVADSYTQGCSPLSKYHSDWLPAIEVRGEGIYLELSIAALRDWEAEAVVESHLKPLVGNYNKYSKERGIELDMDMVRPGYLMIHTLSHLLIKQLSLECGYSSASIRERIYHSSGNEEEYCGVLLYTASASTDGTLGGLVRQGEPENLERMIKSALDNARWCSSDPLCIESDGQGVDALNLAACHACALVSETSCEQRNLLLDRTLLVGTRENPEIGFFHSWLRD